MVIPRIAAYPMPPIANAPKNRVNWTLQPQRAALLIHDMQDYFLNFFDTQQPPIPELLNNITNLRSCCQSLGIPILYTPHSASWGGIKIIRGLGQRANNSSDKQD